MAVSRFGLYSFSSAALLMQLGCVIIVDGMKNEIAWVEEKFFTRYLFGSDLGFPCAQL